MLGPLWASYLSVQTAIMVEATSRPPLLHRQQLRTRRILVCPTQLTLETTEWLRSGCMYFMHSPENLELSAGDQRLPSANGISSSSSSIRRSSKMPSTTTKRERAVHSAGGLHEDQPQLPLPPVRLGGRISISRVPRVRADVRTAVSALPSIWTSALRHVMLWTSLLEFNLAPHSHVGPQKISQ